MHHKHNFLYCKIIWLCFTRNKSYMWKVRTKHWLSPRKDLHLARNTWICLKLLFQLEKHQRNWLFQVFIPLYLLCIYFLQGESCSFYRFQFSGLKRKSLTVRTSDHVLMILYFVCVCAVDLWPQGSFWSILLLLCLNYFSIHKHGPL